HEAHAIEIEGIDVGGRASVDVPAKLNGVGSHRRGKGTEELGMIEGVVVKRRNIASGGGGFQKHTLAKCAQGSEGIDGIDALDPTTPGSLITRTVPPSPPRLNSCPRRPLTTTSTPLRYVGAWKNTSPVGNAPLHPMAPSDTRFWRSPPTKKLARGTGARVAQE